MAYEQVKPLSVSTHSQSGEKKGSNLEATASKKDVKIWELVDLGRTERPVEKNSS